MSGILFSHSAVPPHETTFWLFTTRAVGDAWSFRISNAILIIVAVGVLLFALSFARSKSRG